MCVCVFCALYCAFYILYLHLHPHPLLVKPNKVMVLKQAPRYYARGS